MAVRACQPKPSRIINATAMTCNQDTWWHIIESPEIRDDPVLHVVLQAVCKSVRQTLIQSKRWNSSIDTFVSEAFRQGHFNILLWIDKHCPGFMFRSFLPLTKSRRAHAVRRFFSTIGEYITDRNQVVWLLDRMRAHLKHSKRLTLWFKKLTVMEGVHELAHAFLARGRYDLFRVIVERHYYVQINLPKLARMGCAQVVEQIVSNIGSYREMKRNLKAQYLYYRLCPRSIYSSKNLTRMRHAAIHGGHVWLYEMLLIRLTPISKWPTHHDSMRDFLTAVSRGYVELASVIFRLHNLYWNADLMNMCCIEAACAKGLDILEWAESSYGVYWKAVVAGITNVNHRRTLLEKCLVNRQLEVLQYLIAVWKGSVPKVCEATLSNSLKHGGPVTVDELEVLEAIGWLPPSSLPVINRLLALAARDGNVQSLEWIEQKTHPLTRSQLSNIAREAAANGHVDVLTWVAKRRKLPVSVCTKAARQNGRIGVLWWLKSR